jgi:hypothetical protein
MAPTQPEKQPTQRRLSLFRIAVPVVIFAALLFTAYALFKLMNMGPWSQARTGALCCGETATDEGAP